MLKILLDNIDEFPNITGLHVEFDAEFVELIAQIAVRMAPQLEMFSMGVYKP